MPQTIMLAVHCKKSEAADLKAPLVEFVRQNYGPEAAADAGQDLEEVLQLRSDVINQTGALTAQAANLAKYHCVLTLMESRFPVSRSAGHANVQFAWNDAFRQQKRTEQASLAFEKAAVVFNLGAVQSQLALACDRKTDAGLKDSARHFQESAGTWAHLRDVACLRLEAPRPVDLGPEAAAMLEKLMLGQAQECVLEKAITDGKAPGVIARLAKQAALFYHECAGLLGTAPLNQHFDRSWLAHAQVKALLYDVEATVQNSAALRDADEFAGVAKEIARLRASQVQLAQAKVEARNASRELQENVTWKEGWVATRLQKAERENSTVYLQRIPNEVDLPPIVPASLVKPTPPANLKPTSEEQQSMFVSVVPDSSAKALSRYSDQVDSLIRAQMHKLNGASDDARIRLREWELPEALLALESGTTAALPDGLRLELEGIQSGGGLQHLQELQQQIKSLRSACLEELDSIEGELAAEEKEDSDLRSHYGQRWRRPPSAQLAKAMREKAAGYRSNLMQAGESDKRLEARLGAEAAAFAALDPEAAASQMPRLQAPMLSVVDDNNNLEPAAAVATLRAALEGLNTLSAQRAALEEALKDRKSKDNVLPKLLGGGSEAPEELFTAELRKYDDLVLEVDNNASKSQQLLEAAGASQAAFKRAYGYADWRKACEGSASGLRASARTYGELRDNLGEGLRFYQGLQEAIASLRQQAGDHCMTRRIQRDELIEELRRQAADEADRAAAQMAAMTVQQQQQQQQAPPPQPPAAAYAPPGGYPPPATSAGSGGYDMGAAQPQQQQQQPQMLPRGSSSGGYAAPPTPPTMSPAASGGGYGPPPPGAYGAPPPPGYGPPPPPGPPQHQYYQQQPPPQQPQYQQQQPAYAPQPQPQYAHSYSGSYGAPPNIPPPQQQQPAYQQQWGQGGYPPQQQGPPPPPQQQQQQQPPAQAPPQQQSSSNPIAGFFGDVFGRKQ